MSDTPATISSSLFSAPRKERGKVTRSQILDFEAALAKQPNRFDGKEDLTHYFAPYVYGREVRVPAGGTVSSKIQNYAHINILLQGRCLVATEHGNKEVVAPEVWISEPGQKRLVHVLEDCRWMTVHPNHENTHDLKALEDYVIAPSFEAFDQLQLELKQQERLT